MTDNASALVPHGFIIGCNYWASHAGIRMWSDWRPEVVDGDLAMLVKSGLRTLRVFPLWSDFQPIHRLYGWCGHSKEYTHGEVSLPDDEMGRAGINPEMIRRFDEFLQLIRKHNIRLIVSLLSGWMSGRLFVPPALENKNILTDPEVIRWQVRFIRYFVKRFRDSDTILAWEPGNECNCMGAVNRDQAYLWLSSITNAIRASDPDRPITSGMHSLSPNPAAEWTIQDQAELVDALTTHPYPLFTPHCDQDPINTMRSCLHATAESRMYGDIGQKPAFAEEVGTLGPMLCSDKLSGDYLRTSLFSLWANDCPGLLWWCGFDFAHLSYPPYSWDSMECELGLIRADKSVRPALQVLGDFQRFLDTTKSPLPGRLVDGVCILSENQDQWGVAYSSFVLAKQAGIDLEFQFEDQPLKEASMYFVPTLSSTSPFRRERWMELLKRVRNGATLYISFNDGFLSGFEELTGLEVQTRERRAGKANVALDGLPGSPALVAGGPIRLTVTPTRAQALGHEDNGNPAFTSCEYGKGKVFFLTFPVEMDMATTPGVFQQSTEHPYWRIYQYVAASVPSRRIVRKNVPELGITEHPVDEHTRVVVAVNYSPKDIQTELALSAGWKVESASYGHLPTQSGSALACQVPANDAIVFVVKK